VDDNNKMYPQGVDGLNLNIVAQENVTMMNKGKASFRILTVCKVDMAWRTVNVVKMNKSEKALV
jgi:hypothetical protein